MPPELVILTSVESCL